MATPAQRFVDGMKAAEANPAEPETTPPNKKDEKKKDDVPVFFSQRTLDRFWLAFKYEHPIFSWYVCMYVCMYVCRV